MFCSGCGSKLEDTSKFCTQCGKPTRLGEAIAKQNELNRQQSQQNQLKMMAKSSLNLIANSTGYYCFKCGNYVNRQSAVYNGSLNCRCCGTSIIGPNYLTYAGRTLTDYGFLGSLVAAGYNYAHYDSPERYILTYYNSAYYNQTHYPFEVVASDKGKMGEYLIDVAYQQMKAALPNVESYIFYNLQIPEANGESFQEIDAVIIYGGLCMVIEAKNRSGYFSMNHISDHDWILSYSDGSESKVYNPLLQNNEHIAALDHYLHEHCDLETTYPGYYNIVVLAGDGELNWNIQDDPIDQLMLGTYIVCHNGVAGKTLRDCIAACETFKQNPNYDREADIYGSQHTRKIADALMPLVKMSEEEKAINMRNREEGHSWIKKYPNTFFYAENEYGFPFLVRSNGVHIMRVYPGKTIFSSGYDSFMVKDGRLVFKNADGETKVVRLDNPRDIYEAYKCVCNFEKWDIPERYYNRGNNNSGNNSNSRPTKTENPN